MNANVAQKNLVLLGAGRAHLHVLHSLGQQRSGDMRITLIAPHPHHVVPAMLPGFMAGDYELEQCRVPLLPLIEASGADHLAAYPLALDPVNRRLQLSSGHTIGYDVLSINMEPLPDRSEIEASMPGARENALLLHPLENFTQLWPQVVALAQERAIHLVLLGPGLQGVELALAAAHRLTQPHGSRVSLLTGGQPLLAGVPSGLARRVLARLEAAQITVLEQACAGFSRGQVHLAGPNGMARTLLACDAPLIAPRQPPQRWLANSGMLMDNHGDVVVNPRLQVESHRQVFMASDDSGRDHGATLDHNLRCAIHGGTLKAAPPARRNLHMVNLGGRQAVASWGPLVHEGHEVWKWRDARERKALQGLLSA